MNRIDISFKKLKDENKKALIPFVSFGAGLSVDEIAELVLKMGEKGVAAVEIGIPFSDPLADGPVIQNAYTKALNDGVKLKTVFDAVKKIRNSSEVPVVLMVYYNIVYCKGVEIFLKEAAESGVDGLIVPDIPLEERSELQNACMENNIYLIPLVARTSKNRIAKITENAKGFIYCVSTNGTTGERASFDDQVSEYLQEVRNIVDIPICLGFGISSKETVREVKDNCDGVIVGSAIVKRMSSGIDAVLKFIDELFEGLEK
ncbi:MAG TPA: tryptophan synthase subunit alpha [Clostridium sp.]|nr:tryptophan synthase subunit alpha [Clostridium sp.]